MKHFIRSLEKEYLALLFLSAGVLLVIFPVFFAKISPWVLGVALILRGLSAAVLALHYKETDQSPGKALIYFVMGLTVMILGSDSLRIIGVIWAVLALTEAAEEIDEMWKAGHYSAVILIVSIVSIVLAVLLMTDPFGHFVAHVRILGLEIISSCLARGVDIIKARTGK